MKKGYKVSNDPMFEEKVTEIVELYDSNRRSIPRDKIEGGFAEVLQGLQPTRQLFTLAKAMFTDA